MASHYDATAEPTIWRMPDDLWAACRALLPAEKPPGTRGRPVVPFRQVLDGILHVLRTGCQWKAVPREFGSGPLMGWAVASLRRRTPVWLGLADHRQCYGAFPPSAATRRGPTPPIGANEAPNGMSWTTDAGRPWRSCSARPTGPI